MARVRLLSLFGPPCGSFLVPAKVATAAARSRGQGRPNGRRAGRASLDGAEHGRTLLIGGNLAWWPRRARQGAAIFGLAFCVWTAIPTSSIGAPRPADPASIDEIVDEAAARFRLPPLWIRAVIWNESAGRPEAVSPKGAMGLMQLMPATWRALADEYRLGTDPFDRRANVLAGAAYLRQLFDRFGVEGFLAAYNAGPGRYAEARAGRRRLPAETVIYVARVERSIAAGGRQGSAAHAPVRVDWREAELFAAEQGQGADGSAAGLFAPSIGRVSP